MVISIKGKLNIEAGLRQRRISLPLRQMKRNSFPVVPATQTKKISECSFNPEQLLNFIK
jgi:predicted transcriptional regulator